MKDPLVLNKIKQQEAELNKLREELEKVSKKVKKITKFEQYTSINFQQFISLIFLAAALYILLSKKYNDESQKWAMGTLGTILGYWFGG